MLNNGSVWCRWEPHIHAPGTIMNNQFTGLDAWNQYLTKLEEATPVIEAIAVTDYYVLDTYREVLKHKASGRLPNVKLIFPNVEVRLDVATAKGGFVNLHLFVSPNDADHIEQLTRLIQRLQFSVMGDTFNCTREDLIRLGKRVDQTIVSDDAALSYGANQIKVNFQNLRETINNSAWAKKNILIAVAGGATDGTSGVREAADHTIRREIESFAHVIFASSQAQRDFWLGYKNLSPIEIRSTYGGLKPCLHGSDAHKLEIVATPFGDRFSWIKGGLEFDALRQACIDPAGRAYVGSEPPVLGTPSQVISSLQVYNASWMQTPNIPLNPGLIAVVGARGSGKTAFADMIAAACDSIPDKSWEADKWSNPSFLARARPLIGNGQVKVSWQAGEPCIRSLNGSDANSEMRYPRVRYLSQQFVEDLCSANGMTDGLLREIERVIFEAHSEDDRNGALDFEELLEGRASLHRQARIREAEAVKQISERVSLEIEKKKQVAGYVAQIAQKKQLVAAYTADRAKLVSAGSKVRADRHTQISIFASQVNSKLRELNNQKQAFLALQDEVKDVRVNYAPESLRQTQGRHAHIGMTPEKWAAFLLDYKGDVDGDLKTYLGWVHNEIIKLKGMPPVPGDPNVPLIADNTDLSTLSLSLLNAEMSRLEKLIGADKETQRQYSALTGKITAETAALQALEVKLVDANGAKDRALELVGLREAAYGRAFDAIVNEQAVLEELYSPLMARLSSASGTLKKLSFSVARVANVADWAQKAEEGLIDLRKGGAFKGKGTLLDKANETLKKAWETGNSADAISAMRKFRDLYEKELLEHAPVSFADQIESRNWLKRFAHWLFSTEHIHIHYSIEYDGVDIRKLSPGTRGIVLLLLYLALDESDGRPLVIDQPEENLDPKSVFEELVPLFIAAKAHRQVIIVTHNANLVINTDADQIIIAESGPHPHGELPPITYRSGGLENAEIRKSVCDILEGGEGAFKERARRLRVHLER